MGGYTTGLEAAGLTLLPPGTDTAATWVFPKDDMFRLPVDMPHRIVNTWMSQLRAQVTVVSTPNTVSLHVLDFTRGSFYSVEIGSTIGAREYNRPCAHQYVGKSQSCMV